MPIIHDVNHISPSYDDSCFIADNATIIGDVIMGSQCSVWFNAVIRGDVNKIRVGNQVNIQDGAVIHCTYQESETHLGDRVSVGHNAIIHGCTIEDEVLIGMGAIVMDNAVVPSHTIVGAGTLVSAGKILESGYIYVGNPAKKLRPIASDDIENMIRRTAHHYIEYSSWFKK